MCPRGPLVVAWRVCQVRRRATFCVVVDYSSHAGRIHTVTAIAAVVERRRVWLAGDSQVTMGGARVYTCDPKVWRIEMPTGPALVVGAAGDAVCDTVLCDVDWTGGPLTWRRRIATLAQAYSCSDLVALVGYRGKLYVYDDGAMWTLSERVGAIGTGGDYALGYLHGSQGRAQDRVVRAVMGASRRDVYVGGKVVVVHT